MARPTLARKYVRGAGVKQSLEFIGAPGFCDLCQRPLADELEFGDVEVPGTNGAWGTLCMPCCKDTRAAFGWGRGQRYRRDGDRWPLVAGGPPHTLD